MNPDSLRQKIKKVRERKMLSPEELAQKLNMDARSYKRIESGEKKGLDVETIFRIAEALQVNPLELLMQESLNIEHIENHNNHIVGVHVHTNAEIIKYLEQIITDKDKTIADLRNILDIKDTLITDLKKLRSK